MRLNSFACSGFVVTGALALSFACSSNDPSQTGAGGSGGASASAGAGGKAVGTGGAHQGGSNSNGASGGSSNGGTSGSSGISGGNGSGGASGATNAGSGGIGAGATGGTPATALSGGDSTLSYAIDQLSRGGTLTLTTDGSYDFGSVGPVPIMLLDASTSANGTLDLGLVDHANHTHFDYVSEPFMVDDVANMPGGKAFRIGGLGGGQNPTYTPRLWTDHASTLKLFEQRTVYWPAANQANAEPQLTGSNTWQYKTIWNMADRDYHDTKSNFFLGTGFTNFYNSKLKFNQGLIVASNVPGGTRYFGFDQSINDTADAFRRPYPQPYVLDAAWDMGTFGGNNGRIDVYGSIVGTGPLSREQQSGIQLRHPTTNSPINGFSYPGYIRGFNQALNAHLYETDTYRAIGNGAFCRVAISDSADYYQSTKRSILWPVDWTSNRIVLRVRSGWFGLNGLAGRYINIIGADNEQVASVQIQAGS